MGILTKRQAVFYVVKGDSKRGILPVSDKEFPDRDSAEEWRKNKRNSYDFPLFVARVPKGLF